MLVARGAGDGDELDLLPVLAARYQVERARAGQKALFARDQLVRPRREHVARLARAAQHLRAVEGHARARFGADDEERRESPVEELAIGERLRVQLRSLEGVRAVRERLLQTLARLERKLEVD